MRRWLTVSGLTLGMLALSTAARADVCDLTTAGATCTPIGGPSGAIFGQLYVHSSGTGVIDPFLTIQANFDEQGYNTDGDVQFDEKRDSGQSAWTHDIQLQDVPVVDGYREFLLDINEQEGTTGNKATLSLDQLQIFLSPIQLEADAYNESDRQLNGMNAIYDLDGGGDNWVALNYDLAPNGTGGSGTSDMVVYIPNSLFTGAGTQYVYLFSQFGAQPDIVCNNGGNHCEDSKKWDSGDGFEEWWVRKDVGGGGGGEGTVPEPGTLLLVGGGLAFMGRKLRRKA